MAKFEAKLKSRELRKDGESINEIARLLNVSTSSVSDWCKDIALTKNQISLLEKRTNDPNYGRRLQNSLQQRQKAIDRSSKFKALAEQEIGSLSKRELFLIGIALYWAEGFKKDNQVGFANLDPKMIKLFVRWLSKCFGYKKKDLIFRVTVNISHEHRVEEIEGYWSKLLNVPKTDFRKPFYQKSIWKKEYENPEEYHGVLRIKVRKSTDFLNKIHGWIEGLSLSR